MENFEQIKAIVLERVKPKEEERKKVLSIASKVIEKAKEKAGEIGVKAEVEVEGSIAKDTWLSGDRDIDVFIKLPVELGVESIRSVGLEIAKAAAGEKWIESYAEHPYIEAKIDGYRVDIVPCLKVDKPDARLTAVDRTPFHTRYVLGKLDDKAKDEVRLLKRFMKGIDVYGAELKVGGFSGYLVELLIIHYGSFLNVVNEASSWKERHVIDVEKHYGDLRQVLMLFKEPLVVIDPVDRRRNVAAALTVEKYCELISACRAFLRKPSIKFFFPDEVKPMGFDDVINNLKRRDVSLLVLYSKCPKLPVEVLWGQLNKSLLGVKKLLEKEGFNVLSYRALSDEDNYAALVYELDRTELSKTLIHKGPPVHMSEDEDRFLSKYWEGENVAAGPWIEGRRWVVMLFRK
ncbi:MAG: CCA tRNA nucleotidyltransferase, partial [Candidatus Methanomethylicota archaeon]